MFVTHISNGDSRGGSAIAAYRLHHGLRSIGVDSQMLVKTKFTSDESVDIAQTNRSLSRRIKCRLRDEILNWEFSRYNSFVEAFSHDRAADPRRLTDALRSSDIYNLHWVAGFVDTPSFFRTFATDKKVVWTLHAMEAFTGGCYYDGGCRKFLTVCGACPQLRSQRHSDYAAAIFSRKQMAYAKLKPENFRIVTPSKWLSRQASQSALFNEFDVATIPYGLDTDVFQPRDRTKAREFFGIPLEMPLMAFVPSSAQPIRKGFDLLYPAVQSLAAERQIGLLTIGSAGKKVIENHFMTGELMNERLMSFAYSAADLVVCPSREDNLPNVVLEAIACGTPVVSFDVGGLPDMVRPGTTGFVVRLGDVALLRSAIETVLFDDETKRRLAAECRRVAVEEYSLAKQACSYRQLYADLIASGTTA